MAHSYDSEIEMLRKKGVRLEIVRTYARYMEIRNGSADAIERGYTVNIKFKALKGEGK